MNDQSYEAQRLGAAVPISCVPVSRTVGFSLSESSQLQSVQQEGPCKRCPLFFAYFSTKMTWSNQQNILKILKKRMSNMTWLNKPINDFYTKKKKRTLGVVTKFYTCHRLPNATLLYSNLEPAPARRSFFIQVDGQSMKRNKPRRTWMKIVMIDLKMHNLLENLIQDKLKWRNIFHTDDQERALKMMTATQNRRKELSHPRIVH